MSYDFSLVEKKWQRRWEQERPFEVKKDPSRPKYYALNMFPYPSGTGLHVGHIASYTPTDVLARYKRSRGFNVLNPMGFDAFGLPAEQHAIATGVHPAHTTQKAIDNFRRQLKLFGFGFDWSREISTCDPKYFKWTQYIFIQLFEKGLAYQKEVPVNWCPALKTVLANEEVVDGKSERGGHPVVRVPMKQWMLKITDYAERLLNDLEKLDWPERTVEGQRNWIGRSVGAQLAFSVEDHREKIEVFTTRPDTLFGVTFMVLAPEHPLVSIVTTKDSQKTVREYVESSLRRSEVDRKAEGEKTGVFTGAYVFHPITKGKIPIWIADYVLMDYGTGAIMAVPGHDERDFAFATRFKLPIVRVLDGEEPLPFVGDGPHVNSQFLDGLSKEAATDKMVEYLESQNLGKKQVQYKLRDWLFSRQRYWGEPFPVVHFPKRGLKTVPLDELPVLLPEVANYEPSEDGKPPLARNHEWVTYKDGETGEVGQRETDTMPGSAGSSWYFLRFTDPNNDNIFCDFEAQKYWMPVDCYVGGPEHTVGHLLYARFWQKVLFDAGLVSHDEPFRKLIHQGMVLGADGEKMSKSRGNTVDLDEIYEKYGADVIRLYIIFLGPVERDKPWSETGIEGVRRFLERIWRAAFDEKGELLCEDREISEALNRVLHKTIKKVTDDIELMNLNTAISAMMILVNEVYKEKACPRSLLKSLAQLLVPFAPHFAEELWERLEGQGLVCQQPWPVYDDLLVSDELVEMGVQVNGKMRGTIRISPEASETNAQEEALKLTSVQNALNGVSIKKVIYRPGRILNLIAK